MTSKVDSPNTGDDENISIRSGGEIDRWDSTGAAGTGVGAGSGAGGAGPAETGLTGDGAVIRIAEDDGIGIGLGYVASSSGYESVTGIKTAAGRNDDADADIGFECTLSTVGAADT